MYWNIIEGKTTDGIIDINGILTWDTILNPDPVDPDPVDPDPVDPDPVDPDYPTYYGTIIKPYEDVYDVKSNGDDSILSFRTRNKYKYAKVKINLINNKKVFISEREINNLDSYIKIRFYPTESDSFYYEKTLASAYSANSGIEIYVSTFSNKKEDITYFNFSNNINRVAIIYHESFSTFTISRIINVSEIEFYN